MVLEEAKTRSALVRLANPSGKAVANHLSIGSEPTAEDSLCRLQWKIREPTPKIVQQYGVIPYLFSSLRILYSELK